jgi:hypothetical protein
MLLVTRRPLPSACALLPGDGIGAGDWGLISGLLPGIMGAA